MLGNILPFVPALSRRAKDGYNAAYCGLCKTLGRQYGLTSRFLLSYDMAFVAMIYDSWHCEQPEITKQACFANPLKKKSVEIHSPGAVFAADVLFLLAYHKLLDNIHDEKPLKKAVCALCLPYFRLKYRKAKKKQPRLADLIASRCKKQTEAEKENADIDSLRRPSADMTRAIILRCAGDSRNTAAEQFGFFLGRLIYLLDALLDRDEDEKKGRFNVFTACRIDENRAKEECFMALGEAAYWYSRLELKQSREIIDNTIYISLARKIKFAGGKEE